MQAYMLELLDMPVGSATLRSRKRTLKLLETVKQIQRMYPSVVIGEIHYLKDSDLIHILVIHVPDEIPESAIASAFHCDLTPVLYEPKSS